MAQFKAKEYDDIVYRVLDLTAEVTAAARTGKIDPAEPTRLSRLVTSLAGATLAKPDARRLVAGKSALAQARTVLDAIAASSSWKPPSSSDLATTIKESLAARGIPQSILDKVEIVGPGAPRGKRKG